MTYFYSAIVSILDCTDEQKGKVWHFLEINYKDLKR
jgi:hypothetical protein